MRWGAGQSRAAATIFHHIRYHRPVWFYDQLKYGMDTEQARRFAVGSHAQR